VPLASTRYPRCLSRSTPGRLSRRNDRASWLQSCPPAAELACPPTVEHPPENVFVDGQDLSAGGQVGLSPAHRDPDQNLSMGGQEPPQNLAAGGQGLSAGGQVQSPAIKGPRACAGAC
jgi:hypothetical protein